MPSYQGSGPVKEPTWTRTRWFVGHSNRGTLPQLRTVFPCRYVPTEATHGSLYGYVTGPFRTLSGKNGAYEAAGMRPAFEVQQYGGRPYGWECVNTELTRREACVSIREYRDNQPGHSYRIRRVYE